MPEIAYIIDKDKSVSEKALVIFLEEVERNGYQFQFKNKSISLNSGSFQKIKTDKDIAALDYLQKKCISSSSFFSIPYPQSIPALKILAGTGRLFFNQKLLACDFFGKVEFYFQILGPGKVTGHLKTSREEFDLTACDFLCAGPPHWFIKGISLKVIATEVSWKDLREVYDQIIFSKNRIEEIIAYKEDGDPLTPKVIYKDDSDLFIRHHHDPLPLLILKDKSGAFADLWMDYGDGIKIPFQEINVPSFKKRNMEAEKNWEKDLLETDFIKKNMGNSHYYCPLDKVAKSLSFLLELGWSIQDFQGRNVLLQSGIDLSLKNAPETFRVDGKIKYRDHETSLQDVVGAFNRRERFVQLSNESVGLLPQNWEHTPLEGVIEEMEIFNDEIKISRNKIGTLAALFDAPDLILDHSLKDLKERLHNFQGISKALPGNKFKGELRGYQQQGVDWLAFLYDYGFHGILADDMGLGKTVQVLAFLSRLEISQPVLIVLPTSLIFNWKREIEKFLPSFNVYLHHGSERIKEIDTLQHSQIILTSYSILRLDIALLSKLQFQCVIIDEAQAIKNTRSQLFQATIRLASRFRLSITGTPIENHLNELWAHFRFLIPDLFATETEFMAEIQAGMSDMRHLQKIKKQIRPFMLRRKKEDVAKDLPEKIEQVVWVEMEAGQRRIYEEFLSGIKGNLIKKVKEEGAAKHRLDIFEAILRLRQICCHPLLASAFISENQLIDCSKMEILLQDIETAIEENRKVLVYSQFTTMLSLLFKAVKERGWNTAYLDGNTKNREQVIQQFQEDPSLSLFLISLKAGGVGLNLTAADYVFIYDPWWNEAAENQAINRAHRIGRQDTVIAKRYVTIESIEEKMMKLKEKKKMLIEEIFDQETEHHHLTTDDFLFLLS